MAQEKTKELIKVMQAFLDGKKIESIDLIHPHSNWKPCDNPNWAWTMCDYRIAPNQEEEQKEKHYRPYTMEEFVQAMHEHDGFIRREDYNKYNQRVYGLMVVNVFQNEVSITNNGTFLYPDYKSLCEYYVWSDDGTPCRKEITE